MIRLTVLYNLPSDADEEEFLRWRLTGHQDANLAIPGVVRADFSRIDAAWPGEKEAPYRFMTTLDWPDLETFQKGFYDPAVQADLQENLAKIKSPMFLIGEVLVNESKRTAEV